MVPQVSFLLFFSVFFFFFFPAKVRSILSPINVSACLYEKGRFLVEGSGTKASVVIFQNSQRSKYLSVKKILLEETIISLSNSPPFHLPGLQNGCDLVIKP